MKKNIYFGFALLSVVVILVASAGQLNQRNATPTFPAFVTRTPTLRFPWWPTQASVESCENDETICTRTPRPTVISTQATTPYPIGSVVTVDPYPAPLSPRNLWEYFLAFIFR